MSPTKEEILAHIRRIAEENDGCAPGIRQFLTETGIKRADWEGRYWARWRDAVGESGLHPNERTPRLDDGFILAKLADLTRELGHFPTISEINLYGRRSPGFPSRRPIRRRLGDKANWPMRLLKFCGESDTDEYSDVANICRREVERGPAVVDDAEGDVDSEGPESNGEVKTGIVYLLRAGRHYKVGRTNSGDRRERELAIQLPERAEKVHEISTDDAAGIEHYWHRRFADRRKNGEWFALTASDIKAFKRRKFM
jgi:hypothetical protein